MIVTIYIEINTKTRRMIENHMPTQHGLDTQCRP